MTSSSPISAAAGTGTGAAAAGPDPRRWRALALLALVQFMFALDMTIVNPALPTIAKDLSFSTSGLAWVVNGYTLLAGGLLIAGVGATLGVVISGIIVDEISWRWIFLVNIPVAAVVVFVVPRMVAESR